MVKRRVHRSRYAPLDVQQPDGLQASPGPITSLRHIGRSWPPLVLSTSCASFSIGDALLERTEIGLRVVDQDARDASTTGRVPALEVRAGDRFWLGDVEFLALDAGLEALRPALAACIGLNDDPHIDRALALASRGGTLALVGPFGTGAAWLARQIHNTGPHRGSPFVVLDHTSPPLDHRGTAFVDLNKLPTAAAARVFAAIKRTRVIVGSVAPRWLELLARRRDPVAVIELVPLARRSHDVVPLLDAHWANALGSSHRTDELGHGVHYLAEHPWPGNLDELHHQSRRLLALLEHRTLKAAARALGIRRQTLTGHLDRLGVRLGRE